MQIDALTRSNEENILSQLTVEADLFDTGCWHTSKDHVDLLSSSIAHLELHSSYNLHLGFMGLILTGKVFLVC